MRHVSSPCNLAKLDSIVPAKIAQASGVNQINLTTAQFANDLKQNCSANPCSDNCVQSCKPAHKCFDCQKCVVTPNAASTKAKGACLTYIQICAPTMMCYVNTESGLSGKVAVFDGTGKKFAPCELDSTLLSEQASKQKDLPVCQMPYLYMNEQWSPSLKDCMSIESIKNPKCNPPAHIAKKIEKDSCSLCNAQHCKCASSENGNAMNSIMENMIHDKMGKSNIGKKVRDCE